MSFLRALSERKARLLGVAHCRCFLAYAKEPTFEALLEVVERYADGNATPEELTAISSQLGDFRRAKLSLLDTSRAAIDSLTFVGPIHVGELVTFLASVNHTGRSSMEVGIKVLAEDIPTRRQRHVNSCYFTMVAIEDGRPAAIPELEPVNEVQVRRRREAELRKSARLELSKRFEAGHPTPSAETRKAGS